MNNEVIIFTKFHEDWEKIVDFLLIANYLASPLFYYSYFTYKVFFAQKLDDLCIKHESVYIEHVLGAMLA